MLIVKRSLLPLLALAVLLALLVLAVAIPRALRAQEASQPTSSPLKPALSVEQMEIDAGEVLRGETPHYTFVLKNTGDVPLEITARPTCGCTIADYDSVIRPGKEGKIEADLKTSSFRGRIVKTIEVTSNDPQKPLLNLRMVAHVTPVVQVLPENPGVLALKHDGPTVRELCLQLRDTEPIEVTRVTCSATYATAQVEPLSNEKGDCRAYKLTVTVQPNAPVGRSVLVVTAFTTSKREPQANVMITCEKGIIATPASVYMGVFAPNAPRVATQVITLTRRDGAFRIQNVESSDPNLEVKEETVQSGSQYRLTLTYRGEQKEGLVHSKVTITTDDPRQPRIEIPVLAHMGRQGGTNR